MLPTIWPGDMLMIEQATGDDVAEGDIVLFRRGDRFIAHRVVTKVDAPGCREVHTQGDALPCADFPIADNEVLGRVAFISRKGKCIEPVRNRRLSERAVATLFRRSEIAARVVVGVHGFRRISG
jgi:signal peptidase I